MKIYTSYFGNMRRLPKGENVFLISIAGKTPDWFANSGNGRHKKFTALAPGYAWWNDWKTRFQNDLDSEASRAWYTEHYRNGVLARHDRNELVLALKDLSKDENAVFILLCYETPNRFCHRHIVADWFNEKPPEPGLTVKEYPNE